MPHHISDRVLRRTRASAKQILAQFPESANSSTPLWQQLHNEVRSHVVVLQAQVTAAMIQVMQMAGSPAVGPSLAAPIPMPLLTTPTVDEARATMIKLSKLPSPPKYAIEFVRSTTIIDRLDALKMLLEPLTLPEPKDPSWAVVLEVRGQLSNDCEEVDAMAVDTDNSRSFEKKTVAEPSTVRSKVTDILEEDEGDVS